MEELDGAVVRAWAVAAADAMAWSAARIDAVNVFPVRDADTGTNVRLTVAGGAAAAGRAPQSADAEQVARAFALGCVRSARGNSGVILSQYLEGFAAGLGDVSHDVPGRTAGADGELLARALVRAAAESARAVALPQEGTVLTVARHVGERASRSAGAGRPAGQVLGAALREARAELHHVSAENAVLRQAGVVDAGACALLVLLEALERALLAPTGRQPAPLTAAPDWLPVGGPRTGARHAPGFGGTFEVMMLVRPSEPDVAVGDRLRKALAELGDSVAVVGADDLWHLHVHTDLPAAAIEAGGTAGSREQVVVRLVEGAAAQVAAGDDLGVVIGTASPATAGWFATGGAVVVVQCPGAPVDAAHLVRAAADTGSDHVVVLPGTEEAAAAARLLVDPDGVGGDLPGVRVEAVDTAVGVLRTAVASLALLGTHGGAGSGRAEQARAALLRLRSCDVEAADGVGDVVRAVDRLVAELPSAQAVTLQHAHPLRDGAAVLGALADRFPDLDAVAVGPVGSGPEWRIGVD